VDSFSNLNKQRRAGDNLFVYSMTIGRSEGGEVEPRWSEKTFSFGYQQSEQHHVYTDGRERIYGDPPDWVKGAVDVKQGTRTTEF